MSIQLREQAEAERIQKIVSLNGEREKLITDGCPLLASQATIELRTLLVIHARRIMGRTTQ